MGLVECETELASFNRIRYLLPLHMKFYALKSYRDNVCTEVEPWAWTPLRQFANKERLVEAETTEKDFEWQYFNAFEGKVPSARVSYTDEGGRNPAVKMRGFVGDFDGKISVQDVLDFYKHSKVPCPERLRPQWIHQSIGGGVHLVWVFDKPIDVVTSIREDICRLFVKKCKITRLWDFEIDATCYRPTQYFRNTGNWTRFNEELCPSSEMLSLLDKAFESSKSWDGEGETKYNLGVVREQLVNKFKHREGEIPMVLVPGTRMAAVWDDSKDNPTSGWITDTGIYVHSPMDGKQFWSWTDILGDSLGKVSVRPTDPVVERTWYWDSKYFLLNDKNRWLANSGAEYKELIEVRYGIGRKSKRGPSQADIAATEVRWNKSVAGFISVPFCKEPFYKYQGETYLNESSLDLLPASTIEIIEWGDRFPVLGEFLKGFLGSTPGQLEHWLSWLQRAYVQCRDVQHQRNLAAVTLGSPGSGKTFINKAILEQIFGGVSADAAAHLFYGDKNNMELMKAYVITVDDADAQGSNARMGAPYEAAIKALVANPDMMVEDKYIRRQKVPSINLISITANSDPHSLGVLIPDMQSLKDKISYYMPDPGFLPKLPSRSMPENNKVILGELPYFLAWLLSWEIPEEILTDGRFGLKPFIHPTVEEWMGGDIEEDVMHEAVDQLSEHLSRMDKSVLQEMKGRGIEIDSDGVWLSLPNLVRLAADAYGSAQNTPPYISRALKARVKELRIMLTNLEKKGGSKLIGSRTAKRNPVTLWGIQIQ